MPRVTVCFTSLLVTAERRVPLFEGHVRRLGEASRAPMRAFLAAASPGVYRVTWDGATLTPTPRGPSRLQEGMPTRLAVSPFAGTRGRFPKPLPPSPYEAVRVPGVATLLTDAAGRELYESCVASLVAWDGAQLVLVPEEAPGVASLAEAAVAEGLPHRRAPLLVASGWPLLLINAVRGTCGVQLAGRAPFPAEVRAELDALLSGARSLR